ncbi:uncharacterized protein LOC123710279 [Pieris brassicae]|uniref:Uncharacterized protein n=1 Tax=Pieris brassicae TaxID=7116 RepID=A0A9P0TFH8_PIEBR|nr:uncharacterized protein LOC123710279 [Pieris brassicae]CAH4028949.1 unnamed protein product [Pieris brassicae]
MQETVRNSNERKSLFCSFLEILEAQEKQADTERQLQEEKYQRRTQIIYDFHDRQQRKAAELQRCLEFVSQHAQVLETVLRSGGDDGVPLSAAIVRQAAALQRCMTQCVANASRIRHLLAAVHRPQMDTMLAKMESELSAWTAFLQRAVDATYSSEVTIDNLHNLIAEQRRCVREVSSSTVFSSLCRGTEEAAEGAGGEDTPRTPFTARRPSAMCSTPIARD